MEVTNEPRARIERQLEAAQQITHIGSWEWDVATGTVTWSDELYRIYGLVPRSCEVTFQWFLERLHPEDRERIQQAVGEALRVGGRFGYPERILRPDGSVRELDTVGEVVTDGAGRAIGLIGTCRDVTEQRRREETIRVYADIVAHVQIGLSVWKLDDAAEVASFRLVACNPAAEHHPGTPLRSFVGRTLPAVYPEAMATELPALMAAVAKDGTLRELGGFRFGAAAAQSFSVKVFALPDRSVGLALEDVSERTRAQRLQLGEKRALEMLAAGAPLGEILAELARLIEGLAPGTLASVLLVDEPGTHLRHGAAPNLPHAFVAAIDGSPIGPAAGSCGTAAFRRAPVFVTDIDSDPLWASYRALADAHGLRACWSTPILANDGRVLGTFAMYYRERRAPDPDTLELIGRATHVAAIAIERRQLDEQLRALSERIEGIREDERTAIAREVHDELGQALTALKMDLALLERRARGADASVTDKLAEMQRTADEILQSVRRISAELRPGVLDDLGLLAALEWQAGEFEQRTGTRCRVESNLGDARPERELATAVFRIFQESLTNVTRHAEAHEVAVRLQREGGTLSLEVADDGVGVPPDAGRRSLGLLGMRERARRLGGECQITRREPRGTLVSLSVPLRG